VRIISDEGLPSAPSRDQIDETLKNVVLGSNYDDLNLSFISQKISQGFLQDLKSNDKHMIFVGSQWDKVPRLLEAGSGSGKCNF
jgi:hypothetical protein